jgi:hypothetical protein
VKFLTGFVWIDPMHYPPLARTAEACGWDGIVLSDHLVHLEKIATPYPYAEGGERPWQAADPYPDVWVSTGAMGRGDRADPVLPGRLRGTDARRVHAREGARHCIAAVGAVAYPWASGSAG